MTQTLRLMQPQPTITWRVALIVAGSVAFKKKHRGTVPGLNFSAPFCARDCAYIHRHITEIDIDRTWVHTLMAHGAMIRHIREFIPMFNRNAATCLLFVEESFNQQNRVAKILLRSEYKRFARGTWVEHTGFTLTAAR